ncbi:hypothetical protein J6590_073288 [Homalodisca vitripennis]|nr:hypothetical protein J6590_073288 [Homalodisca vitripennis]
MFPLALTGTRRLSHPRAQTLHRAVCDVSVIFTLHAYVADKLYIDNRGSSQLPRQPLLLNNAAVHMFPLALTGTRRLSHPRAQTLHRAVCDVFVIFTLHAGEPACALLESGVMVARGRRYFRRQPLHYNNLSRIKLLKIHLINSHRLARAAIWLTRKLGHEEVKRTREYLADRAIGCGTSNKLQYLRNRAQTLGALREVGTSSKNDSGHKHKPNKFLIPTAQRMVRLRSTLRSQCPAGIWSRGQPVRVRDSQNPVRVREREDRLWRRVGVSATLGINLVVGVLAPERLPVVDHLDTPAPAWVPRVRSGLHRTLATQVVSRRLLGIPTTILTRGLGCLYPQADSSREGHSLLLSTAVQRVAMGHKTIERAKFVC